MAVKLAEERPLAVFRLGRFDIGRVVVRCVA